jgi:ribosomal protein S18 acetylase RimI-like enzyme
MAAMTDVRPATPDDAEELTRLRLLMIRSLNDEDVPEGTWTRDAEERLRKNLADPEGPMRAFVVDAPGGEGLAASSIGVIDERLPSASNPVGREGYIFSVSTDPRWRRRGYARGTVAATLDWFAERGVRRVVLQSSPYGLGLYRELGFEIREGTPLRLMMSS